MADPVKKQISCPSCGQVAEVRLIPGGEAHTWHCPHCKKFQTSDAAAVAAAAVVGE